MLQTPLMAAAYAGNWERFQQVLEKFPDDLREEDEHHRTLLHAAVLGRNLNIIQEIIKLQPDLINVSSSCDSIPLHLALSLKPACDTAIIHALIAPTLAVNGDSIHLTHRESLDTALNLAIHDANAGVVRALLEAGANPHKENGGDDSPLQLATEQEDVALLRVFVSFGVDVNVANRSGMTPLHAAIAAGRHAAVQVLLEAGALVDAQDKRGWTPLHEAVSSWYGEDGEPRTTRLEKLLLDAGADPRLETNQGQTAIHCCVSEESFELLLAYETDVERTYMKYNGGTLLHCTCATDSDTNVKLLIDRGWDVNRRDARGSTPLHYAAEMGCTCAMQCLLDHGAHTDVKNNSGYTPLHVAMRYDKLAAAQRLLDTNKALAATCNKYGNNILHEAAVRHVEMVDFALQNGLNVNAKNGEGATPLHLAITSTKLRFESEGNERYRDEEDLDRQKLIIQLLLREGADINAVDNHGNSIQDITKDSENQLNIAFIIKTTTANEDQKITSDVSKVSADQETTNERPQSSSTPLHEAVNQKRDDLIKELIVAGCDINQVDTAGRTALHRAAAQQYREGVSLLLEAGADVNLKDASNHTPIHTLININAYHSNVEAGDCILHELLAAKPRVCTTDTGVSFLHLAVSRGSATYVRSLLHEMPELATIADTDGNVPLHYAAAEGNPELVAIFLEYDVALNVTNRDGMTPLHIAASDITDRYGVNANTDVPCLIYDREHFFNSCVVLLAHKGAALDMRDINGSTPLYLAMKYQNNVIEKTLSLLNRSAKKLSIQRESEKKQNIFRKLLRKKT